MSSLVFFLPQGTRYTVGRVDQGVDYENVPYGTPILAMGHAKIVFVGPASGFGPQYLVYELLNPPPGLPSNRIYVGHSGPALVHVGQIVQAGQPIIGVHGGPGYGSSTRGHLETGFAKPGGLNPLSGGTGTTSAGRAFSNLLRNVGHVTAGSGGTAPASSANGASASVGPDVTAQGCGTMVATLIAALGAIASVFYATGGKLWP